MEVVANKEVLVAEKEVMVEARGFDKEWEETHVVKLRWLVPAIPNSESSFCLSINTSVFWGCNMYFQGRWGC